MPSFPILDAHVHLWDPTRFHYPWLDGIPALRRPFLPADYTAACGPVTVDAMVFMQCETAFAQALDEARWVSALAKEEPRLRAIIPWAPLEQGEDSRAHLEALAGLPLVKGVRRLIQSETDPEFCLQPGFVKGVQTLARFGFTFDLCISHRQLANTIKLVRQCPAVTFILDHIGKPDIKNRRREPWEQELRELARLPNVACKLSGLVTEADVAQWTPQDLKPYIDHVLTCFGFDRVLFGGDWPVVTLASPSPRWVSARDWAIAGCAAEDQKKLFYRNAIRLYRIKN